MADQALVDEFVAARDAYLNAQTALADVVERVRVSIAELVGQLISIDGEAQPSPLSAVGEGPNWSWYLRFENGDFKQAQSTAVIIAAPAQG